MKYELLLCRNMGIKPLSTHTFLVFQSEQDFAFLCLNNIFIPIYYSTSNYYYCYEFSCCGENLIVERHVKYYDPNPTFQTQKFTLDGCLLYSPVFTPTILKYIESKFPYGNNEGLTNLRQYRKYK